MILEARGLRKAFGGNVVLAGVDLAIPEHRLTAIIGPNGAGKTTCFNVLTGFLAPDGGHILFKGAGAVSEAADKAAALVRLIGLAGREEVAAKHLSYGQRRLLELGVALAGEPELLLMDEPTSGLGSRPMETLRQLVQRLRETLTIVVIEHDMNFVLTLSDHIAVLHRGAVIAEGAPEAIREHPEVREAYLGTLRHMGHR